MHPPFLFWSCQNRNGPYPQGVYAASVRRQSRQRLRDCTVQREKTLRRVGLRQRRPPAAGWGWLAVPCRSQGRKRAARVFAGAVALPHAATLINHRPAAAKIGAACIPDFPGPKDFPKGRAFPSLTSTRKCQLSPAGGRRSALAQTDPPNIFSFPPGAAHFLFDVSKRKWGAHPLRKQPPWREPDFRGRCSAARIFPRPLRGQREPSHFPE